ncbi:MAG: PH domain-containing protein [Sphingomicrobium sp.]
MTAENADQVLLLRPEPAYRTLLMARAAINWLPLTAGVIIADRLVIADTPFALIAPALMVPAALVAVLLLPARIYRRLGYRIHDRLLQSVRGWLFHTDTLVPFVRVQHIDVTRGPLDKVFGTASLIVHTAGTHNSIVRVDGLAPARATEIRDLIREHIRTDVE